MQADEYLSRHRYVIAPPPVNIEANVETFKAWPAKIVVLIIMFIITAFILSKTLLGKYNKAIGEKCDL